MEADVTSGSHGWEILSDLESHSNTVLDMRNTWYNKAPETWNSAEILNWIYFNAGLNGIPLESLKGEKFQKLTGKELCEMSVEDFKARDPDYGEFLHLTLNMRLKKTEKKWYEGKTNMVKSESVKTTPPVKNFPLSPFMQTSHMGLNRFENTFPESQKPVSFHQKPLSFHQIITASQNKTPFSNEAFTSVQQNICNPNSTSFSIKNFSLASPSQDNASTVVTLPINVFHQILKFNPKFSSFPNFNHSNISQPTQKTCSLEDNTELKLSNNINFSSINKSMNNQIPKVTNLINRKNPNLQNNLASSNFFLPPVINIKISNNTNRDLTNNKTNEVIAVQPMTKKNITVEKVINTVDVPDSPTKEALIPTFIQNITDDDDDDEDENADSKKDHFIKINCYKPAMKADVSKSKETFIKGQTLQKNNTKTTTDGNNNIIASDSNGEENRNSDFESNLSFTGLSYYRLKKLKEQYGPEHLSSLQLSKNPKKRTSKFLLSDFMRDLLNNPKYNPSCVCWEDKQNGVFRIVSGKSKEVATLWGKKKNNPKMNFEKMGRSLRWCRANNGNFSEVPKNDRLPKKLIFRLSI